MSDAEPLSFFPSFCVTTLLQNGIVFSKQAPSFHPPAVRVTTRTRGVIRGLSARRCLAIAAIPSQASPTPSHRRMELRRQNENR
jgi:hypothetical protein